MAPKDTTCETCGLHSGIVTKIKVLFVLAILVIGTVVTATVADIRATDAAVEIRHDLDVHSAEQNQRIKNIEQTVTRIESLLRDR